MSLPAGTRQFTTEVKWYLGCYRAWSDTSRAIIELRSAEISVGNWKVQWAGISALMKASVHLMKVDAKRCFSAELRDALKSQFDRLLADRASYPLFWQFIDRERHKILKEYEFSAYEHLLIRDEDASPTSLLASMFGPFELRIKGGPYEGRLALDVAFEAAEWLRGYIEETIRLGGFEPDERIESDVFLGWKRVTPSVGLSGLLAGGDQ